MLHSREKRKVHYKTSGFGEVEVGKPEWVWGSNLDGFGLVRGRKQNIANACVGKGGTCSPRPRYEAALSFFNTQVGKSIPISI